MKRKPLTIVHVSDWHGYRAKLPAADLYVVTGDMLPNFSWLHTKLPNGVREKHLSNLHLVGLGFPNEYHSRGRFASERSHQYEGRHLDHRIEHDMQVMYVSQRAPFRDDLGNPDAPVVVVRGNHDFTDLGTWIGGDVWEVTKDPTHTDCIQGWTIGGFRGIKFIHGEWSDEILPGPMFDLMEDLPLDIDMLISHSPPTGVFDLFENSTGAIKSGGIPELQDWQRKKASLAGPLQVHFFGHVHESKNVGFFSGTTYSNAATGANLVRVFPNKETEYEQLKIELTERT